VQEREYPLTGRGRRLARSRTPAEGEPWRAVLAEADVDVEIARSLAAAAESAARDTGVPAPVNHRPAGRTWVFLLGGRWLDPVEAVDVVDAWLAAFDANLGPEWPGARGYAWRRVLEAAA
jgi:hypothetical protein